MSDGINIRINVEEMASALSSLKQSVEGKSISVKEIIRNAGRDFVRRAGDAKDENHQWYIHESMLAGRADLRTKGGNWKKFKSINKEGRTQLRRASVKKGYSRATWAGAFVSLGLTPKNAQKKYPKATEGKSYTVQRDGALGPEIEIADMVAFDRFGRSTSDPQHERIIRAGFANAAAHMASEYNKLLRKSWKKK